MEIESKIESDQIKFKVDPNPPFGTAHFPIILYCEIDKNTVKSDKIILSHPSDLSISPFCSTLHYGQAVFEGIKAFKSDDGKLNLFRAKDHARRFSQSAKIMAMPLLDQDFFLECMSVYLKSVHHLMPSFPNHSLYLRPLLYAQDSVLKVKSSEKYTFVIMACLVGDYFSSNSNGLKVLINPHFVRAFPGGTGEAKTAANYAASLSALDIAYQNGYDQVLYVDALKKTNLEELGGMNFFFIQKNLLLTPKLSGTILRGITRQSLLEIAPDFGLSPKEENISLDNFLQLHSNSEIDEVFATGTAASIAPITQIGVMKNQGINDIHFNSSNTAQKLRQYLIDTQLGKTAHSKKWLTRH